MTPLRNDRRLWTAGGALAIVVVIALAWFAVIGPELASASSLDDQTSSAQQQNLTLQSKVAKLKTDSANPDRLNQQLRDARAALPVDSGMPDLTRQLGEQAAMAGVVLMSVSADAPTGVNSGSGTAATPAPTGASGATVSAAGNLFAIPVTVVANGSLQRHRAFLAEIEQGPRAALIDSVAFGAGQSSPTASISVDAATTMTVKLRVFAAPQTPAAQAELQKQLGS
jgi:hypothetical protein